MEILVFVVAGIAGAMTFAVALVIQSWWGGRTDRMIRKLPTPRCVTAEPNSLKLK